MSQRLRAVIILGVLLAILIGGNVVYWRAEGGGSPSGFRNKVAATGLDVDWTRNGSQGGSGFVETECGARTVTINLGPGDELWFSVLGQRIKLDETVAAAFTSCDLE